MGTRINEINKRYGRLLVINEDGRDNGTIRWKCLCDCGNYISVRGSHLRKGFTRSCKCLQKESRLKYSITHGKSKTQEYAIWKSMKERCYTRSNNSYKNYGQRGIQVCERWKNNFMNFLNDMGKCPKNLTLERINNNGDYSPQNCKWASILEQANNTRKNRHFIFNNHRMTTAQIARKVGIKYSVLMERIYDHSNYTIEQILNI